MQPPNLPSLYSSRFGQMIFYTCYTRHPNLEFLSGTPLKARLVNTNLKFSHKIIVCCLLSQPGRGAVPEVLESVWVRVWRLWPDGSQTTPEPGPLLHTNWLVCTCTYNPLCSLGYSLCAVVHVCVWLTLGMLVQLGLRYLVCHSVHLCVTTFSATTRNKAAKSDTNGFSATLA